MIRDNFGSGNLIPIAPKGPKGGTSGKATPPPPPATDKTKKKADEAAKDPYAYAKKQQAEADADARKLHLDSARTLQQQVDALRAALGKKGFKRALDIQLGNVRLVQRQQDNLLMDGYHERVGSLRGAATDNKKAADGQTVANTTNRARERMQALSEAFAQGAGESDVMRAQEASLRNWNANQSEITRSYFDTLRSINSSLTDLTVDTKTARVNNAMQANADRQQLWQNYFNQRSETYTALGNTLGQQASEYSAAAAAGAKDQGGGSTRASGNAFDHASVLAGKAWDNPGVGKKLMGWDGRRQFGGSLGSNHAAQRATTTAVKRPEGASLRSW